MKSELVSRITLEFGRIDSIIRRERFRGSGVKWFFLASFVAALVICALLTSLLVFALVTHDPREFKVALFVLPQLVLFGWAAREMLRSFKGVE
jgi:hypothetical protein